MTTAGDTPHVSFVVRLWLEPNVDQPEWRGQVTHVQGQASTYFRDFNVLLDFLTRHSGVEIPLVAESGDMARADGARRERNQEEQPPTKIGDDGRGRLREIDDGARLRT